MYVEIWIHDKYLTRVRRLCTHKPVLFYFLFLIKPQANSLLHEHFKQNTPNKDKTSQSNSKYDLTYNV